MISALLLALTPPPEPGWVQPVYEGPGIVCGRSIGFLLHTGEIALPGFSAPTVRPAQFSIELGGRTLGLWERPELNSGRTVETFEVPGSPFTFERTEYGLVTFEHHRDAINGVEISFGPDPLAGGEREALLARFVDRPDESLCLTAGEHSGQEQ